MSLGQLMIFVSSLQKAKSFYVDLIGLEVAHDMSEENGMLIMKNDGSYLTIHEGFKQKNTDQDACRITPIFKVKDVQATRKILETNGVHLEGGITETSVHHYQMLKDFDGNWIEVAQFKN
ncbi:MAG TPA: VOC family protein [Pseudobdellovibrionaceae bacterium]|jgi:predicted enzyme related to lactoylglutathione lyase